MEYFIGPMNPDELFTIEFNAVADNSSDSRRETSEPINLTLSASYGNGINKHENIVSNMSIQSVEETRGRQFEYGYSRLTTCCRCCCRCSYLQKEEKEQKMNISGDKSYWKINFQKV